MSRSPTWLLDSRADVHSQTGEDGIILKILETLPEKDGWLVEFGAWDGEYLSNACNLIDNRGYSAILIEGSAEKFKTLQRRYAPNPKVSPINRFVGFHERDSLDTILGATPVPTYFDFLSIDIDGNDYHVWEATQKYKPKAVCVEFNPTIPTPVRFVQPPDPRLNQGSSLLSLSELGKKKGYELVSVLPFNAFFVREEYYHLFEIGDNRPETLRTDASSITHIFFGYDGTVFLRGACNLPWHGVELRERDFQALPGVLRKYPSDYGRFQRALFALFRRFRS